MEGEHGQKAKEMRRKYFERQKRGLEVSNYSSRVDVSSFSMVSDSESSDSDSDEYFAQVPVRKVDTSRKNTLSEHPSPSTKNIFSGTSKKSFFSKETKQRAKQWEIIASHWDDEEEETRNMVHERINELIVHGIPSAQRSQLWCMFASTHDLQRKSEGLFEICLNSRHSQYDDAIKSDITRTLPDHPLFIAGSGEGQTKLFQILRAYSSFNPSVGYVQCMNFIAGYMYTQIRTTELTFWTFVSLMQSIKGLFAEGLPLLNTSIDIFDEVIRKHIPVLYAHFAKQKFNISPIVSRWCSTLFCCPDFSFKFSIHALDMCIYKGYPIIFRIGQAILSEAQGALLKLEGDEIQFYLQQIPQSVVSPTHILLKANKTFFDNDIEKRINDTAT